MPLHCSKINKQLAINFLRNSKILVKLYIAKIIYELFLWFLMVVFCFCLQLNECMSSFSWIY